MSHSHFSYTMEPSDILRELCLGAPSLREATGRSVREVHGVSAKLILFNPNISLGEKLCGQVFLTSNFPKENITVGLSLKGEIKLAEMDQSESANGRLQKQMSEGSKSEADDSKKKNYERKWTPCFGPVPNGDLNVVIEGEEKKEEESESEMSGEQFKLVPLTEKVARKKKDQQKDSQESESIEENRQKYQRSSSHLGVNGRKEQNGGGEHNPIHPISIKSIRGKTRSMVFNNSLMLHSFPDRRAPGQVETNPFLVLFQLEKTIFAFDRAMPEKMVFQIPFEIDLPDNLPTSDCVSFNEEDKISLEFSGFRGLVESLRVEYSISVFTQDEKRKKLKTEYERQVLRIDKCLSKINIPSRIIEQLKIQENELEVPFFSKLFNFNCCSSEGGCFFKARFKDLNEMEIGLECKYFKSSFIEGFLVTIECEIDFNGTKFLLSLWQGVCFPEQGQSLNWQRAIKKSEMRVVPTINTSVLKISCKIRVQAMSNQNKGHNRRTWEVVSHPINFEWFLMKKDHYSRVSGGHMSRFSLHMDNDKESNLFSFNQSQRSQEHKSQSVNFLDHQQYHLLPYAFWAPLPVEMGVFFDD